MKKLLLFASFVLGNFAVLSLSLLILTVKTSKQSSAGEAIPIEVASPTDKPYPQLEPINVLGVETSATIVAGDAAEQIVEIYLRKYNSPMIGLGKVIVDAARKYQIPFAFLPAIGQCEGNLGKSIPANSYNTWGYGIYGGQITRFANWQDAIDKVSKGIRTDYFDFGLTTPETMMAKYAPPSDGSWANCVNRFLAELQ